MYSLPKKVRGSRSGAETYHENTCRPVTFGVAWRCAWGRRSQVWLRRLFYVWALAACSLPPPRIAGFWVFRRRARGGGAIPGPSGRFWGEGFMRPPPGRRELSRKPTFCSPAAAFW